MEEKMGNSSDTRMMAAVDRWSSRMGDGMEDREGTTGMESSPTMRYMRMPR